MSADPLKRVLDQLEVLGRTVRREGAGWLVYRIQFLRQVEVGIHAASPRRMRRCAAGIR